MGAAIPIIAKLAAPGIGGILLRAGLSLAVSFVVNKLFAPEIPEAGGGGGAESAPDQGVRQRIPSDTNNKLPVVYGESRIYGSITFADITADNQKMAFIISLCEGPVANIGTISWDDWQLDLDVNGNVTNATDPNGNSDDFLTENLLIKKFPTGGPCTPMEVFSTRWANNATNRTMPNVAYLYVELDYDRDKGVTGLSSKLGAIVNGKTVRTISPTGTFGTIGYSDNPAECLVDYLTNTTYGCGNVIKDEDLDLNTFADHKAFCNEFINSNRAGGMSGTESLKRYQVNGVVNTNDTRDITISDLTTNSQSVFSYQLGKFQMNSDRALTTAELANLADTTSNTYTATNFGQHNMYGEITIVNDGFNSQLNTFTGSFNSKSNNFQDDQIFLEVPTSNKNFNEPELIQDTRLKFINNNVQAERVATTILNKSRNSLIVSFTTDTRALSLQVTDIIRLTNSVYGFNNKLFRVNSITETRVGADGIAGYQITAQEYAAEDYTPNLLTARDTAPNTNLPNPRTFGVINDITSPAEDRLSTNPTITLNWTVPTGLINSFEIYSATTPTPLNESELTYVTTHENVVGLFETGSTVSLPVSFPNNLTLNIFIRPQNQFAKGALSSVFTYGNWDPTAGGGNVDNQNGITFVVGASQPTLTSDPFVQIQAANSDTGTGLRPAFTPQKEIQSGIHTAGTTTPNRVVLSGTPQSHVTKLEIPNNFTGVTTSPETQEVTLAGTHGNVVSNETLEISLPDSEGNRFIYIDDNSLTNSFGKDRLLEYDLTADNGAFIRGRRSIFGNSVRDGGTDSEANSAVTVINKTNDIEVNLNDIRIPGTLPAGDSEAWASGNGKLLALADGIAVASWRRSSSLNDSGFYVFKRAETGTWSQTQKYSARDAEGNQGLAQQPGKQSTGSSIGIGVNGTKFATMNIVDDNPNSGKESTAVRLWNINRANGTVSFDQEITGFREIENIKVRGNYLMITDDNYSNDVGSGSNPRLLPVIYVYDISGSTPKKVKEIRFYGPQFPTVSETGTAAAVNTGNYSGSTTYNAGNFVVFSGNADINLYKALQTTTGNAPTKADDDANWEYVADIIPDNTLVKEFIVSGDVSATKLIVCQPGNASNQAVIVFRNQSDEIPFSRNNISGGEFGTEYNYDLRGPVNNLILQNQPNLVFFDIALAPNGIDIYSSTLTNHTKPRDNNTARLWLAKFNGANQTGLNESDRLVGQLYPTVNLRGDDGQFNTADDITANWTDDNSINILTSRFPTIGSVGTGVVLFRTRQFLTPGERFDFSGHNGFRMITDESIGYEPVQFNTGNPGLSWIDLPSDVGSVFTTGVTYKVRKNINRAQLPSNVTINNIGFQFTAPNGNTYFLELPDTDLTTTLPLNTGTQAIGNNPSPTFNTGGQGYTLNNAGGYFTPEQVGIANGTLISSLPTPNGPFAFNGVNGAINSGTNMNVISGGQFGHGFDTISVDAVDVVAKPFTKYNFTINLGSVDDGNWTNISSTHNLKMQIGQNPGIGSNGSPEDFIYFNRESAGDINVPNVSTFTYTWGNTAGEIIPGEYEGTVANNGGLTITDFLAIENAGGSAGNTNTGSDNVIGFSVTTSDDAVGLARIQNILDNNNAGLTIVDADNPIASRRFMNQYTDETFTISEDNKTTFSLNTGLTNGEITNRPLVNNANAQDTLELIRSSVQGLGLLGLTYTITNISEFRLPGTFTGVAIPGKRLSINTGQANDLPTSFSIVQNPNADAATNLSFSFDDIDGISGVRASLITVTDPSGLLKGTVSYSVTANTINQLNDVGNQIAELINNTEDLPVDFSASYDSDTKKLLLTADHIIDSGGSFTFTIDNFGAIGNNGGDITVTGITKIDAIKGQTFTLTVANGTHELRTLTGFIEAGFSSIHTAVQAEADIKAVILSHNDYVTFSTTTVDTDNRTFNIDWNTSDNITTDLTFDLNGQSGDLPVSSLLTQGTIGTVVSGADSNGKILKTDVQVEDPITGTTIFNKAYFNTIDATDTPVVILGNTNSNMTNLLTEISAALNISWSSSNDVSTSILTCTSIENVATDGLVHVEIIKNTGDNSDWAFNHFTKLQNGGTLPTFFGIRSVASKNDALSTDQTEYKYFAINNDNGVTSYTPSYSIVTPLAPIFDFDEATVADNFEAIPANNIIDVDTTTITNINNLPVFAQENAIQSGTSIFVQDGIFYPCKVITNTTDFTSYTPITGDYIYIIAAGQTVQFNSSTLNQNQVLRYNGTTFESA